jgi:tRNA dimethylallyltransferase
MSNGPGEVIGWQDKRNSVWIGGATASGKSAVAVRVAQRLQGEIVTVDSMQVYRGLDIGTAKPRSQDQGLVPHHLLNEIDVSQAFNVAAYVSRARQAVADINRRGRLAVLCGGTGLYFKALLEGIGSAPEPDMELRRSLEQTHLSELLKELQARDPETFAQVDRQNPRRVIRAVEILRTTGKGVLDHRAAWSRDQESHQAFFVLQRCRDDLRERIERRVDRMFEEGLVEETRRLMVRGLGTNRVALQAIGYRQVVEHLQGLRNLDETRALIKQRTWQFARRQRNWFERRLPAEPLEVPRNEAPETTAERLVTRWSAPPLHQPRLGTVQPA